MITFLLFGMAYVTATPVPTTVFWLTSLIDGMVLIPAFSIVVFPFLGRAVREKTGRLLALLAAAPSDGWMAVLTPTGYALGWLSSEDTVVLSDGRSFELGDDRNWYRLANRRFGVTYLPEADVFGELMVGDDEPEFAVQNVGDEQTPQYEPIMHGDKALLAKERAGKRGYTTYADGGESGFLVSLPRAISALREGGNVQLSEQTELTTRMKHGGGTSLNNWHRVIAYLGTIFFASAVGLGIFAL